jgi:hypothetical protein
MLVAAEHPCSGAPLGAPGVSRRLHRAGLSAALVRSPPLANAVLEYEGGGREDLKTRPDERSGRSGHPREFGARPAPLALAVLGVEASMAKFGEQKCVEIVCHLAASVATITATFARRLRAKSCSRPRRGKRLMEGGPSASSPVAPPAPIPVWQTVCVPGSTPTARVKHITDPLTDRWGETSLQAAPRHRPLRNRDRHPVSACDPRPRMKQPITSNTRPA